MRLRALDLNLVGALEAILRLRSVSAAARKTHLIQPAFSREVGSSCIAERCGIEILDHGQASTLFMRNGEHIRMEARLPGGQPLFGEINQTASVL
ncbi:hypothetical protein [Rhizobium sp. FKY42]|uniref:hypothetical protein n=1 Tax=Rhizobium sp. FKY42 TaxID=2562310 RepID=UPI0010C0D6E0|nr:hypothetical protein [Rhizobium sp. FKY42]